MKSERFSTEAAARTFAKKWSANRHKNGTLTVLESPSEDAPDKPFIVEGDSSGMIRSWERHVADYKNGKDDADSGN